MNPAATAKIAQTLLAAGLQRDDAMLAEVQRIGREFEFHRATFNPDYLDSTDAALASLYRLFDVTPVASRKVHDGLAAIVVAEGTWHDQHQQLWELLVPASGAGTSTRGVGVVGAALAGPRSREFLLNLAGNRPDRWSDGLKGWDRLRVIVNAMTRLRFCTAHGHMDLSAKGAPHNAPPGTLPWFRVADRFSRTHTIVCGHWSALGFYREPGMIALDSGCVWGGKLTALRIEDDVVFQVPG